MIGCDAHSLWLCRACCARLGPNTGTATTSTPPKAATAAADQAFLVCGVVTWLVTIPMLTMYKQDFKKSQSKAYEAALM